MKWWYWLAGVAGLVAALSCSSTGGAVCGAGTALKGGQYVAQERAGGAGVEEQSAGTAGESAESVGGSTVDVAGAGMGVGGSLEVAGDSGELAGAGGEAGGGEPPGLITTLLDCGSRDVTGATVVSGPITGDTTWSGVVHLPNGVSVRNEATVTILPGTKILVGHSASVEVGYLGSHATLLAQGTVARPIAFCGETGTPGYWGGLAIKSGSSTESVLRNVLVADAGSTLAGLSLEVPLHVQGVQVRGSAGYGVSAIAYASDSSTLLVSGSGKAALRATSAKGLEVPPESALTGNTVDAIEVAFSSFDTDVTLANHGVPYRQLADTTPATVAAPPTITIEPGVVYRIAGGHVLDVGNATVRALGTSAAPIRFEGLPCLEDLLGSDCSSNPSPTDMARGGRIFFNGGNGHELHYVELRKLVGVSPKPINYGSLEAYGALTVRSNTELVADHVQLTQNVGHGLRFEGPFSASSRAITGTSEYGGAALVLSCEALRSLPADTVVTSSTTFVNCGGAQAAESWVVAAGPYVVGNYSVDPGGTLTLKPGTVLRMQEDATLTVQAGGTLKAAGTPNSTIQLLSGTGYWVGIHVEQGSSVTLDNVSIVGAGSTTYSAYSPSASILARGPLSLTHSSITSSKSWAVLKASTDQTDYVTGNTFSGNSYGNVGTIP